MAAGKFISYCRVSTQMQGSSGLGLEAQKKSISDYLNGGSWELIGEYIEVESGKKNDRPQLKAALAQCDLTGATLIIAKLDRLARNVHFISNLMESGVDFVAVDFPTANRLTVHILAAVAEHEGKMISERTRNALQAAKARGIKLGAPCMNISAEAQEKGAIAGGLMKMILADSFALKVLPNIIKYRKQSQNLSQIAASLNAGHIRTARGKEWTAQAVKNVLRRQPGGTV